MGGSVCFPVGGSGSPRSSSLLYWFSRGEPSGFRSTAAASTRPPARSRSFSGTRSRASQKSVTTTGSAVGSLSLRNVALTRKPTTTPWVGPWLRCTTGVIEVALTFSPPCRETFRPAEALGETSIVVVPMSLKAVGLGR